MGASGKKNGNDAGEATRLLHSRHNDKNLQSGSDVEDGNRKGGKEGKEKEAAVAERSAHMLTLSFVGMVVFGLGNTVFNRLETQPMYNYPYFINLWSNAFIVPVCFAYIIPGTLLGWIPKEDRDLPKWKFAVMGFLDMASSVMSMLAITYMSSPALIILLQQATIPISMALSKCFLKAEYQYFQYWGAAMVCAGLVLALLPVLTGKKSGESGTASSEAGSSAEGGMKGLWEVLLLLSNIPTCLSSIYKEKAMGQQDMDVIYLNGWTAFFQLFWTIPAALPSAYIQKLWLDQMPENLYQGWVCYFYGRNSNPGDDCRMAPLYVNLYLVFNLGLNLNDMCIVKYGGANMMWMASTILVPLSNIAFTLKFVPGHQGMDVWDIIGLITIVAGLITYRFYPDLHHWFSIHVMRKLEDDYHKIQRSLANVNMEHRVFHRIHVPHPHHHPRHIEGYRYKRVIAVDLLVVLLSVVCVILLLCGHYLVWDEQVGAP